MTIQLMTVVRRRKNEDLDGIKSQFVMLNNHLQLGINNPTHEDSRSMQKILM